jgi:hypothetical protein
MDGLIAPSCSVTARSSPDRHVQRGGPLGEIVVHGQVVRIAVPQDEVCRLTVVLGRTDAVAASGVDVGGAFRPLRSLGMQLGRARWKISHDADVARATVCAARG